MAILRKPELSEWHPDNYDHDGPSGIFGGVGAEYREYTNIEAARLFSQSAWRAQVAKMPALEAEFEARYGEAAEAKREAARAIALAKAKAAPAQRSVAQPLSWDTVVKKLGDTLAKDCREWPKPTAAAAAWGKHIAAHSQPDEATEHDDKRKPRASAPSWDKIIQQNFGAK